MSIVEKAGLLATPPEAVPESEWPEALRASAVAVYALAEPVISTGSFLKALAARHEKNIRKYDGVVLNFDGKTARIGDVSLEARALVLTAGEGNAALLRRAGVDGEPMQRRPLLMALLRGDLPPLFGHCIVGGKTRLTVTTPDKGIWQVGGELSERLAGETDLKIARKAALTELRRWLPAIDLTRAEIAFYPAVRAEARTADQRRPSGVHAAELAPGIIAAWPTKLAMAPVLADEVFALAAKNLQQPSYQDDGAPPWPAPAVARYPWEEAEWSPAR
jgi:hypothetical protein